MVDDMKNLQEEIETNEKRIKLLQKKKEQDDILEKLGTPHKPGVSEPTPDVFMQQKQGFGSLFGSMKKPRGMYSVDPESDVVEKRYAAYDLIAHIRQMRWALMVAVIGYFLVLGLRAFPWIWPVGISFFIILGLLLVVAKDISREKQLRDKYSIR